jgi:hypothetical protein
LLWVFWGKGGLLWVFWGKGGLTPVQQPTHDPIKLD